MTDFALDQPKAAGTNLHGESECRTCGGDRYVLVALYPSKQSVWMDFHQLSPRGESEAYAACPACNPVDTSFRRHDGFVAHALDTAKVRELMQQVSQPRPKQRRSSLPENRRQAQKLLELFSLKDVVG